MVTGVVVNDQKPAGMRVYTGVKAIHLDYSDSTFLRDCRLLFEQPFTPDDN